MFPRRIFLKLLTGVGAVPVLAKGREDGIVEKTSVISHPPRQWGNNAPPIALPDPDILVLDESFRKLLFPCTAIKLVWHGGEWIEGPSWSTDGRFLLLSDTVRSQQYRYDPEDGVDGHMSIFRKESFNANGNTYDQQGRLITCEHGMRRLIRWEHDGSVRVLADRFNGQNLNSPNDVVVSPRNGNIWFTDPRYGDTEAEGHVDDGHPENPYIGTEVTSQYGGIHGQQEHVFSIDDKTGTLKAVLSEKEIAGPNGLCFSPDGTKLYIISSSPHDGIYQKPLGHSIYVFDVAPNDTLSNGRVFTDFRLNGYAMSPDGIRADVHGNLWCGASGPLGLCGVFIYNPQGKMIGRLRLPAGCSNLTFGGQKRNVLYACCGTMLFSLITYTQGAGYS